MSPLLKQVVHLGASASINKTDEKPNKCGGIVRENRNRVRGIALGLANRSLYERSREGVSVFITAEALSSEHHAQRCRL